MTPAAGDGAGSSAWTHAQAIAAACVGLALLAGTGLSGISRSGPAFPATQPDAPVSERGDLIREVGGPGERAPGHTNVGRPGESGKAAESAMVDINRADAAALQTLPGVGPTLAQRIVEHRALHGPFRTPEDLLQVSGIGAMRYARLHGRIRTGEGP